MEVEAEVSMKNLYETATAEDVKLRLQRLRPDSQRHWGKMGLAQMLAHCASAMEMATGEQRPRRTMIGRVLGPVVKRMALRDEEPMRRNSPTAKFLLVNDEKGFESERTRLIGLVDRFAAAGPAGCTTHPHLFFGPLTPDEWAQLMFKHLDHHLRQFGV
jgi:hypothetical protein